MTSNRITDETLSNDEHAELRSAQIYSTFKRRGLENGWGRKSWVDSNLTIDEARRACRAFNENRTSRQVRNSYMMEFTS